MTLFEGVVSKPLAAVLLRRQGDRQETGLPPPEALTATVFFSDIKGFTTISEALPEAELAGWLNEYMSPMVTIIERYGGVIEKFAGDGLTVTFGLPAKRETTEEIAADARAAVDAALAMARVLPELNRSLGEPRPAADRGPDRDSHRAIDGRRGRRGRSLAVLDHW